MVSVRARFQRLAERSGEPVFEDADAADAMGVAVLPVFHQLRLDNQRQVTLKGPQYAVKSLQVSGTGSVTAEVQVNAAARKLPAEIPKVEQLIGSQQDKQCLRLARQ